MEIRSLIYLFNQSELNIFGKHSNQLILDRFIILKIFS